MKKIYLDDLRTPLDKEWILVRNYSEFVTKVLDIGLENISDISLDHDLGDSAMDEYFNNVQPNYTLDYNNIHEKTGYDCAKWLVEHFYELNPEVSNIDRFTKKKSEFKFPKVTTHSANPIGASNIMGYINNFLMNEGREQNCVRVRILHV
jgi:hypothetical protein